jgi:flagellar basal-body rod modification protein FlgD
MGLTEDMEISSTSSSTSQLPAASRIPVQVLGQEDFLKLLVAQMTAQDPLNPQKDTEFIAQMAQFSALEQSKSTQSEMAKIQANGLLGKTVEMQVSPELILQGTVTAVQIEAGTPKLVVNGQQFDLSQVMTVTPGSVSNTTPTP